MKEKLLLKLALMCSVIGIFVLFLISENVVIEETTLDKIDGVDFGEDVKIMGVVEKVVNAENVIIIDITQPETVSVVLFKEENITIEEGSTIEVIGELDEYNGELEIIGDRVRVIK
jgi:DNA/RNA endonuclease YhcR with UshA esterase domain|tara:strand:+ start:278 stop:625 length:348 start_codon:yes stop_codon:yes gene_type:complete